MLSGAREKLGRAPHAVACVMPLGLSFVGALVVLEHFWAAVSRSTNPLLLPPFGFCAVSEGVNESDFLSEAMEAIFDHTEPRPAA